MCDRHRNIERRGSPGDVEDPVKVARFGNHPAVHLHRRRLVTPLRGRGTAFYLALRLLCTRPSTGTNSSCAIIYQWVAPDFIVDNTGDLHPGIEVPESLHHRVDAARDRVHIDDKDARRPEDPRHVCGTRGIRPLPSSKRPIALSMTAISAPAEAAANVQPIPVSPIMQKSRFRDGRPQMSVWCEGSIKSGPVLNGCTVQPRVTSAAIRPLAIVVLPQPLCVPAITTRGYICLPDHPRLPLYGYNLSCVCLRTGTFVWHARSSTDDRKATLFSYATGSEHSINPGRDTGQEREECGKIDRAGPAPGTDNLHGLSPIIVPSRFTRITFTEGCSFLYTVKLAPRLVKMPVMRTVLPRSRILYHQGYAVRYILGSALEGRRGSRRHSQQQCLPKPAPASTTS